MESPGSWNLITSSLAVCDLGRPNLAWAFLLVQGLVRGNIGECEAFIGIVEKEQARGEITGPSLAYRIASSLIEANIVLPAGQVSDPWGECATRRIESIAAWGSGALGNDNLENIRRWSSMHQKVNESTKTYPKKQ